MKSRMERYYKEENVPSRTTKNDMLYDEIYNNKKEPASNVTVLDNISEIDISKIKSIINNREDYKKIKEYKKLINSDQNYNNNELDYNFEDLEEKNYDINEILERKRSNRNSFDEGEKIRKISNTQYDILKGLSVNEEVDEQEEMDMEFFTQEKQLKTLISNITKGKEEIKDTKKTSCDLFENLKGDENTRITSPVKNNNTTNINNKEQIKDEDTFYTSKMAFAKDDFEELEQLKTKVNKTGKIMKFLIVLVILFVLFIGFIIASNYIDFKALLN